MNHTLKAALLISSALVATPALAQQQQQPTPPERYTLDPRGVDLVSGTFNRSAVDFAIGSQGGGGLVQGRSWVGKGWRDTLSGTVAISGSTYTVSYGPESKVFTKSGSAFVPAINDGSTLTQSGPFLYLVAADGTRVTFNTSYAGSTNSYQASNGLVTSVQKPDGEALQWNWRSVVYCPTKGLAPQGGQECLNWGTAVRLESVSSNRGYQINFQYVSDAAPYNYPQAALGYLRRSKVIGINLAVENCPQVGTCAPNAQVWPSVTYSGATASEAGVNNITDQDGRVTSYSYANGSGALLGIRNPGSSSDDVTISYVNSKVASVTDGTGTWNYSYSDSGSTRTTTVTGPLGQGLTVVSDLTIGRATSVKNALNQTISYTYDGQRRLQRVTQPEGDYAELTYDARGNVTQTTYVAKPGSGLSNLTTTASFPATCSNPVTCNKPTSTTDARGAVTDYAWNGTHGGLESVTLPAPTAGAVRPQTRITYAAQTAYFKNSSGAIVASPTSITLPVSVSQCATNAAPGCVGTLDEVRQTVQYGTPGVANNLLPTVVTQGDGAGTLSASVTTAYTANGDVASVDGPLPGAEDTTYYRYDTARRPVGVIGPDPDGPSGSLLRRAQRVTYDAGGRPTQVEQGIVSGLSDTDWNGFNSLQQQLTAYDAYGRPVIAALRGGGAAHSVTHIGYDAAGRQSCVATRMNPAAFDSLPGSACDLGAQGAYGPDRITKYEYNAASQMTKSTSGFGTANLITEEATYTANGKPLTLKDGAGNVSTMTYDGFDRLVQLNYPDAATGAGTSSATDLEQYGYDANSNVIGYRNRAGEVIDYSYDALNRQVGMGGAAIAARTISYDNLNRLKGMNFAGGGASFYNIYDALNRLISQTQAGVGTMSYGYDHAGRRTSISWPDGFWAAYDYDYANELTGIRENGATDWRLSAWAYDNLGRPIAQSRGNGATTYWSYDAAGRLSALSHDAAGTANDFGLNLAYNPAGQIVTRTLSNSAYAYQPGVGNTAYANNGKNQVTSVNGAGVGYDGRQNITSVPGMGSYGYNGSNELTSATVGGATTGLSYDPGGRLYQSGSTRFLYDGQQVVGEYNTSGGLLRRYVPGLGLDNVVTAYEGSGYDRRWLLADERRSVVSITDGSANALTTNTYDEYGQPGSGNGGRFQYTGQMWLPEAQLYHYRARAYAPQLGRFMQTDPIGYQAGLNIYAYVGADPINLIDPFGLEECVSTPETTCVGEVVVTHPRLRRTEDGGGCGFWCQVGRVTDFVLGGGQGTRTTRGRDHTYEVRTKVQCSAAEGFDKLKAPGMSAPNAPRAIDGLRTGVILQGNNPITQFVDPINYSITNTTEDNHRYFPGSVELRLYPSSRTSSTLVIRGTGTTPRSTENTALGLLFFQSVAERLYIQCTPVQGD
ncbi:RHS repeat-associated core domain-containing protein [uncultured Brevundimonas sp.]|uniref:RHS repeat domain-containing protein n=1 Tax=uncultured Brevundimonas sp. TaxID=213418 RepID=UPI0025D77BBD|nr:RHS repeat-associated core domain-containing protein [uncultured Brevundimonas sp.]